jgi:hypothetical protein
MNSVVKDEKTVERNAIETDLIPILKAEKNRWHVVAIAMLAIIAILIFNVNSANERAEMNTEVIYLKMFSDGTWQVAKTSPDNVQDFYATTVDKLLEDYVVARYGLIPATIRRDYGFVLNFLSPALQEDFTSDKGFNAAQKAADVLSKIDHPSTEVKVGVKDHYDRSRADFSNGTGEAIRSNIYFTEQKVSVAGVKDPDIKRYILSITWRLLTPPELKGKTKDYFQANPIGIEIIKQDKYLDPANK